MFSLYTSVIVFDMKKHLFEDTVHFLKKEKVNKNLLISNSSSS